MNLNEFSKFMLWLGAVRTENKFEKHTKTSRQEKAINKRIILQGDNISQHKIDIAIADAIVKSLTGTDVIKIKVTRLES